AELPSQALEAVERKSPGVLKDSRESAVVRGLDLHGTPVVAKRYLPRGGMPGMRQWLGHGRGRRAWVAGNTCRALEVPVAKPIALLEGGGGEAWVVMADLHDHTPLDRVLHQELRAATAGGMRSLARQAGRALGMTHRKSVLHADWKACNIMIGPEQEVVLVDYDRVAFLQLWHDRPLSRAEAIESLRQLNCSVPRRVSRTGRLRFLKSYAAAVERPDFGDARSLFLEVWAASKPHKILSVSAEGDVHETWDGASEPAAAP
ncbi:MAG: lipopolysaccharide kinase InaA family protein, partial [Planctomycetota bacterium]